MGVEIYINISQRKNEFDERKDAAWNDNGIQFARLLAEVHVVISDDLVQKIADSMGISLTRVRKLFRRAEGVYMRFEIFGNDDPSQTADDAPASLSN